MSQALAPIQSGDLPDVFTKAGMDLQTVRNLYFLKCSDEEIRLGFAICRETGLSPIAKQIWFIVRETYNPQTKQKEPKMTVQVAADGLRLIAERTGKYAGWDGPYWCGADGQWTDVWLDPTPPRAAKVGVRRLDWASPCYAVATYSSYCQTTNKDGGTKPTGVWATMPEQMLAKCAEALALRKAFPQELSGLYSREEMAQVDSEPIRTTTSIAVVKPTNDRADLLSRLSNLQKDHDLVWDKHGQVDRDGVRDKTRDRVSRWLEDTPGCVAVDERGYAQWAQCTDEQLRFAITKYEEVSRGQQS